MQVRGLDAEEAEAIGGFGQIGVGEGKNTDE